MDECSFAPKINRKIKITHQKSVTNVGSAIIEQYYQEDEEPRHIDKFVEDQNRFLSQKRAKEEFYKAQ
jgi:predicted nucleotidyltransferase